MASPTAPDTHGRLFRSFKKMLRVEVPDDDVAHEAVERFERAERRIEHIRKEVRSGVRSRENRFRL